MRVLVDRERRLALVVVEVVPEDVVVDDRVVLGRRELLRVERVRHDAGRVVVEAALRDRHVAHVGRAEAQRAAPAFDVADDRAHRLRLRRRLPDVERAVVDVVGLGVDHPAADGVERVQAVDAGLARDQVVHRVAREVREEEPVGLVAARHEPVDGDLIGGVDEDAVLHAPASAEQNLLRVLRVADQLQVALLLAVDLHGLAVDAVADADRVAGARLVDGLLDRAEVAATLLLADRQRLVRALGLGLDRAGACGLGYVCALAVAGASSAAAATAASRMRIPLLRFMGRRRTSPPSPRPDARRRGSGRASDRGCLRRSGP